MTTASIAHPKIEKKIMDEKIAKVREVVKNISTNDIVLALHNFGLDVERTIHAFCEGGSVIALGDWEKTGGTKKRNNKKKTKPMQTNDCHPSGILTKANIGTSSISSSISSANYSNGFSSNFNGNNHHQSPPNFPNGSSVSVPIGNLSASSTSKQENGNLPTVETSIMINGGGPMYSKPASTIDFNQPVMEPIGSIKIIASTKNESNGSINNLSHLEQNKSLFENEIASAQNNIQQCFKDVRDALTQREQQLMTELTECHRNGLTYFSTRSDVIQKLDTNQQKAFSAELDKFNTAKTDDLETALTTRFLYDNTAFATLVSSIGQFGGVIPVKMPSPLLVTSKKEVQSNNLIASAEAPSSVYQQAMRRSNSPSSLVSSLDSGIGGQISPVNQGKVAVAQLDDGGIVLKSDCISADQLAEIQRNILESLKAKGIDPSVLADINSSAMTAPRRRQPPPTRNGGGVELKGGVDHKKGDQRQRNKADKGGRQGKKLPLPSEK